MMSKIKKIEELLTSIDGLKVYHYWHTRAKAPFCVWQENSEGESLHTDNHKAEQVISGSIDYYTLTEYDPCIETIQNKLNETENVGWVLNSVQYEDETNLIHYEWLFEVI